jgi:hypothetical protein
MKARIAGQVHPSDHRQQPFPLGPLWSRHPHKTISASEKMRRIDRLRSEAVLTHAAVAIKQIIIEIRAGLECGQHVCSANVDVLALPSVLAHQEC